MRVPTLLAALCSVAVVSAEGVDQQVTVQQLFEAGKYGDAADRAAENPSPENAFLRAHSLTKLDRRDEAREVLSALVSDNENDAWSAVAHSAIAVLDGNGEEAVGRGRRAAELAPESFYAQYQLGIASSLAEDYTAAAAAFETAIRLNPSFAYAHYYAGQADYKLKKIERMASHFQTFLRLAPDAPERPAVEQLLRTLRGR